MKISILSVARVRHRHILDGEKEYLVRFTKELRVEIRELGLSMPESMPPDEALKREAKELKKALPQRGRVILLDQTGTQLESSGFAALLDGILLSGVGEACFVIGGPLGVADDVKSAVKEQISLSRLTLPHGLARLVLLEQLYRAYTMVRSIPYHK
jgi:23S rRNA (pseudouridine1915-N3)-methyltransferase